MTQPRFKLPAHLMASFLALATSATGFAQGQAEPSDTEIVAALKRTPRIEETAKGQEILKELMRASAFIKDTRRIQINQDSGKGTKYDRHDVYYNCKYARRHAGTAGFELRLASINPQSLFDKPATNDLDQATRTVVGLSQTIVLEYFLGSVQQETDQTCGREGAPLPPDVAANIDAAQQEAANGNMQQAQARLGAMLDHAEQTKIGGNLYDTHQQVEAHEAIKHLGRWAMNSGFMTDKDHKSWRPLEEELRQPQRVITNVRALLDMK